MSCSDLESLFGGLVSEIEIIDAAKRGDASAIERLLAAGADVNAQDEYGWTALHWAAGKGLAAIVSLLLKRGANASISAKDRRSPYLVAKAAGRREIVALLVEEGRKQGDIGLHLVEDRLYCKAFSLGRLRQFYGWSEQISGDQDHGSLDDSQIVYLHHDFSVTQSISHGDNVVFDKITPEWKMFCE